MKKILKLFVIPFLVFSTSSCSCANSFFPDPNELPEEEKVLIERSVINEIKDISYDQFKSKCLNKDTFVSFVYSEECYHCYQVKSKFLPNFFDEYDLRIYGVKIDGIQNTDLSFIGDISDEDVDYYKYNEKDNWHTIYFPVMYIIEEGFISYYALGNDSIKKSFFTNHLVIDKKAGKFSTKEKISLLKEVEAKIVSVIQIPSKGIVYYTSNIENEEIKYYLKPYVEDKSISINVIVDESLTSNKLSIVSNSQEVKSTTQKKDYLALLENYIEVI